MTYENINFNKANMVVVGGYFYMFDEERDILIQKVDDGSIIFSYPLNTSISEPVKSLEFDGINFWTLQDSDSNGIVIKRWKIENNICCLKDKFLYSNTDTDTYSSDTFALEHYHTSLSTTISGGDSVIHINRYYDTIYDSAVTSGVVLVLGPNNSDQSEEVIVTTVSGVNVTLVSGTQYSYDGGDRVNFYKSFFVFNNYDGTDDTTGVLFRFNAYTGKYLSSAVGSEFKDVRAATFYRFQNIFLNYLDIDVLAYVKGTNAKFCDVSNLLLLTGAYTVNDDFTGSNGSLPNSTRWDV
jgi:hypothetical protein